MKAAVGAWLAAGAETLTGWLVLAVAPLSSVTVRRTVYVPAVA